MEGPLPARRRVLDDVALVPLGQSSGQGDPDETVDEGTDAWLKVLGCFLTFVMTYGIATSFGVYQAYYQTETLQSYSPSTISWVGTLQIFLLGITGIVAGPLFDKGHVAIVLSLGCFLVVLGLFMLSISHTFYQIMLSQSVCIGIGNGLIYVPAVSAVSSAFTTKRPIANGLAASGASVGGVLFPVLFRSLTPTIGFGWTNRIFGFLVLAISPIAVYTLQRKPKAHYPMEYHHAQKTFLDTTALTDWPYIFLSIGLFFAELGYWIPPFLISPYAQLSLGTTPDYAFYLVAIMNAGGFAGRILPAYLAQIAAIGPAWVLVGGAGTLGVLILAWLGVQTVAGITALCVLLGFTSGIVVTVPNAVLPKLSPSMSVVGTRSGMMWTFVSFAGLIGAPLAGILVNTTTNNYSHGLVFSGASMCFGSAMLCLPAVHVTRKTPSSRGY